jgi:uncharacterized protein (DUF488 family)
MSQPLYTIGYEGINVDELISILNDVGTNILVDVRELPLSRKPGFSKNGLREALNAHGIEYCHMRALGCPKDVRHTYREDGDWFRYTERYLEHLSHQQTALEQLRSLTMQNICTLLCYEADASRCHRSYVALKVTDLANNGLHIWHLNGSTPKEQFWPGDLAVRRALS